MDPARVYSFSRSRYISASWSSSTRPTLVSCGVEVTNNSFVIHTPGCAGRFRAGSSPEERQGEQGRIERRDGYRSTYKWACLLENTPEANPLRKLGNLLHLSQSAFSPGL